MIQDYQQIELYGKKIFEKAVVSPPFRFFYGFPNEACFFYLEQGCTKLMTPIETFDVMTKEGVVMQCGNYFSDMIAESEATYCEAVAVHFHPEILKKVYDKEFPEFLLEVKNIKPLLVEKQKSSPLLKSYIESLQFYFSNPKMVSDELIKLKIKELLLLLAKSNQADVIHELIVRLFSTVQFNFKTVIEANIFNNLSLEELAKLTSLSLSSFKREFAKNYNESPARYIRFRKLEKAAKLLAGTDLRISDIAYDCGFGDIASFSKSFQKKYERSPSQYRLDYTGKNMV